MERQSDGYISGFTDRNLKKEIVLLEGHYREFIAQKDSSGKTLACKDCIDKHLLAIFGYAEEALKYLPNNRDNWNTIIAWGHKRLDELPALECKTDADEKHIYDIIEQLKEMRLKASGEKLCYTCQLRQQMDK